MRSEDIRKLEIKLKMANQFCNPNGLGLCLVSHRYKLWRLSLND